MVDSVSGGELSACERARLTRNDLQRRLHDSVLLRILGKVSTYQSDEDIQKEFISTLLKHVPVPLAAAHQGGAVLLLSCALFLAHGLRLLPAAQPASAPVARSTPQPV